MNLVSPTSGRPLTPDTPHSLWDGGTERWPVVDGIPYLRANSEGLAAVALDHLDAGCPDDALVALLTDQDDWWVGPATDLIELKRLVRERDTLCLRDAMSLLRLGPVADYFAHRWCDPTYLAGLALLEAHWAAPATAFELACGVGHYLRELGARGVACVGADVVFAKCWLAKHWVAPETEYVVFDAGHPWPVEGRFDLVTCQDAFYFLPNQPEVARRLRALADGGVLAVGHLHNEAWVQGAKGPARSAAEWATLFPNATVHDEADLLGALLRADLAPTVAWHDDPGVEAWSVVEGGRAPRPLTGGLVLPVDGATLTRNPLLGDTAGHDHVRWPSDRWREEYGPGCYWANRDEEFGGEVPSDVRLRRVLDLPARW